MDTVIGIVIALLVALLGLWVGKRRAERRMPPELVQALRLDKKDPAAARQLMDHYFARQAGQDSEERAQLWQQAPTDLNAATELRRRLTEDLATDAAARQELNTPQLLSNIEQSEKQARAQIAKLDDVIQRLRMR